MVGDVSTGTDALIEIHLVQVFREKGTEGKQAHTHTQADTPDKQAEIPRTSVRGGR